MKFFLDTANIENLKQALDWGLCDGVTTNPSLIAKEGNKDYKKHLKKICKLVKAPVSAEVIAEKSDAMVEEARILAALDDNIVVKIPATFEGLKAVKTLTAEKIRTNVTLIFSPSQALLAAKAGATYVSPFVGRLDDISVSGMDLIRDILTIFSNYMLDTEVIVASVRHPQHVVESALLGADVVTLPLDVLKKLMSHPLTDSGIEKFLSDWNKLMKG
ncbi:MAG: Transaldolase [Candidatus Aminicenantes bacterium ADurb.Bin508]|nr:MAG: Transaldolase [Candidatus Aminicenantes bacterium ADurb.Bin508]HNX41293.1 fructose-6-phosphate aldolase [Candidatus Aminicenantes bacterium]HPB54550.1 fructose-6-phosphate aldolase [Candidatus Aminicenantes bacterium]HPS99498.1 fructose-6-phosphate aldolase [Candidatus Aminicenantes bacterium]